MSYLSTFYAHRLKVQYGAYVKYVLHLGIMRVYFFVIITQLNNYLSIFKPY